MLHYTAMMSAEVALDRLCDPEIEASSHWLIGRDGTVWRLVDEAMRAWHAGAGTWRGRGDVNSRSIGIEIDNDGVSPFAAPAMRALEVLMPDIMGRWGLGSGDVIGHSDMAWGRKTDPGRRFDWRRLGRQGLAPWPAVTEAPTEGLDASLIGYGYDAGWLPADRLAAFRHRFHPGAEGPATRAESGMAAALAALDRRREEA